jgi:hypothetical protein
MALEFFVDSYVGQSRVFFLFYSKTIFCMEISSIFHRSVKDDYDNACLYHSALHDGRNGRD